MLSFTRALLPPFLEIYHLPWPELDGLLSRSQLLLEDEGPACGDNFSERMPWILSIGAIPLPKLVALTTAGIRSLGLSSSLLITSSVAPVELNVVDSELVIMICGLSNAGAIVYASLARSIISPSLACS